MSADLSPIQRLLQALPSTGGGKAVEIVDLPADLQRLDRALKLEGKIMRAELNRAEIATRNGTVVVKLPPNLQFKEGQPVVISLARGQPPQSAQLTVRPNPQSQAQTPLPPQSLPVTSLPPALYTSQGAATQPPLPVTLVSPQLIPGQPVTLMALPPQTPVLPAPPSDNAATVLKINVQNISLNTSGVLTGNGAISLTKSAATAVPFPSSQIPLAAATTPSLMQPGIFPAPPSTQLSLPQTTVTLPAAGVLSGLTTVQGTSAAASFATVPAAHTSALPTPPGVMTPAFSALNSYAGNAAFTLPDAKGALLLNNISPDKMQALVVGKTPSGQAVVQLPGTNAQAQMLYTLPAGINVSEGSVLTLSVSESGGLSLPRPMNALGPWPLLQEISSLLQQTNPSLFQAFHAILPNAARPRQVPATAFFFLAATRSGDLSTWLGQEIMSALPDARRDAMVRQMFQETLSARPGGSEPQASGEWRTQALPFVYQGEIYRGLLHTAYQDGKGQGDRDKKKGETHFVLDLDMNRLGPLQIDGLHSGKNMNMIIRSARPFSDEMRTAMRRVYHNAVDMAGLTGRLDFNADKSTFLDIKAADASQGIML